MHSLTCGPETTRTTASPHLRVYVGSNPLRDGQAHCFKSRGCFLTCERAGRAGVGGRAWRGAQPGGKTEKKTPQLKKCTTHTERNPLSASLRPGQPPSGCAPVAVSAAIWVLASCPQPPASLEATPSSTRFSRSPISANTHTPPPHPPHSTPPTSPPSPPQSDTPSSSSTPPPTSSSPALPHASSPPPRIPSSPPRAPNPGRLLNFVLKKRPRTHAPRRVHTHSQTHESERTWSDVSRLRER